MPDKLRIIHTNDLHSHFENWPKIKRFIQKKQETQASEAVLTVDLGDFLDRWHPLTEATDGKANIELMNEIHYDAVTLGNNEGIGNSHDVLDHLYDQANFPVVLANLIDQQTKKRPSWVKPYLMISTNIGITVGVIGVTAPFPLTYQPNGWDVLDPIETLRKCVPEISEQADYVVLLSHLGIEADDQIAHEFEQIDLILGSHTHHLFKEGKKIKQTQLAAAGKFGYYVGEVEVTFADNKQKLSSKATTFLTESLVEQSEDQIQINSWFDQGVQLLEQEVVADLPFPLTREKGEHLIYPYALQAMAQRGDTAISLVNSGLFLDDLPQGVITKADLHRILPHPMRLIRVTLRGSDVVRLVREIEKNRLFLKHYPIKGMGFRGKLFGEVHYLGLDYDANTQEVSIDQHPIDPNKCYTLTTVDHFMFIPFFPTIELAGEVTFLFPEFLRTVVANGLSCYFPIDKS